MNPTTRSTSDLARPSSTTLDDLDDDDTSVTEPSHRGGFGDFGGASGGLIERTFRERIVLVGVSRPAATTTTTPSSSLDELALLVDTAGADEVARVVQRRDAPDPATYIGKGKAEELRELSDRRSTPTPSSSTTSCRPASSSTSRSCSAARPSTAPR